MGVQTEFVEGWVDAGEVGRRFFGTFFFIVEIVLESGTGGGEREGISAWAVEGLWVMG